MDPGLKVFLVYLAAAFVTYLVISTVLRMRDPNCALTDSDFGPLAACTMFWPLVIIFCVGWCIFIGLPSFIASCYWGKKCKHDLHDIQNGVILETKEMHTRIAKQLNDEFKEKEEWKIWRRS